MDKLNLTFQREEVLTSASMNRITGKVDELVQSSNDITNTVKEKADKVATENATENSKELQPNKYYIFGEKTTLTITLAAGEEGKLAEYMFEFTSGATATTLSLPESVKWIGDHKVEANTSYQVSIANNVAVMGGFKK